MKKLPFIIIMRIKRSLSVLCQLNIPKMPLPAFSTPSLARWVTAFIPLPSTD